MNKPFTSFADFRRRYPIRPNDAGSLLGSGSYGRVFKVEDQLETEWVAVKVSEFKGDDPKSLKAEVELAQRMPRQANIARYDACYRLETDTSISDFAIMKYYQDGNLADLLAHHTLNPIQIYEITGGILLGLQHLHGHRIVHRDFKPANILISRDSAGRFIPKIADFGLSRLVSSDELKNSDFDLSDGRGTPSYKAPEQIEGNQVSFNLDLWAFGVILYEIMTGEKPFRASQQSNSEQAARLEIEKKIIAVELPARIKDIPEPYAAMIRRCLVRDIHARVRREAELLDLLDGITQRLANARKLVGQQQYEPALVIFEEILSRREHHAEATKEAARCRLALTKRQIYQLLSLANGEVAELQYERAKAIYEELLQLDPAHPAALDGRALCVSKLRPQPEPIIETVGEGTDTPGEKTDVFPGPPVTTTVSGPVSPVSVVVTGPPEGHAVTGNEPLKPPAQLAPWWRLALMAVVVAAVAGSWWIWHYKPPEPPGGHTVAVKPLTKTATLKNPGTASKKNPTLLPGKKTPPPAKKRVDALQTRSQLALNKKPVIDPPKPLTVVSTLTTPAEEPKEVKPPVKTPRQEAQEDYDKLIDEGLKAIAGSNNKAKAKTAFGSARALASQHGFGGAEADAAYAKYIRKGDNILESNDFDGAKEWYLVAQSLKDTPEVRRKIKQCNNQ